MKLNRLNVQHRVSQPGHSAPPRGHQAVFQGPQAEAFAK